MNQVHIQDLTTLLDGSVTYANGVVEIHDPIRLRATIHRLAEVSALDTGARQVLARYLIRKIALEAGLVPASINDLYMARGRGEIPSIFTVPAINLRALSFDAARAVYRAAKKLDAAAFIFEIARSEMGYTDQRPGEYASSILAAGIVEGYSGPIFVQGDHFQVSAKRYESNPETELQAVRDLIDEALLAGFYNIDVDTSTLVDITRPTIQEQQELNTALSAMFTAYIRSLEPEGITVSIGGEIGEVGGQNSTEAELRAYMDGFSEEMEQQAPGAAGLSKISIQTGTSHGGIVLPDGSIKEVAVDFDTLHTLSRIAREDYGLAGAVQHGASTLPEEAFGKFAEAEACEVHLATNFQNMMYDRLPIDLRAEMYAYLDENHNDERKLGMTDEQFYYKSRKRAIGPFKKELWNLDGDTREQIKQAWEDQFYKLFTLLRIGGTRSFVEQTIDPVRIDPRERDYLGEEIIEEDVSDLAD